MSASQELFKYAIVAIKNGNLEGTHKVVEKIVSAIFRMNRYKQLEILIFLLEISKSGGMMNYPITRDLIYLFDDVDRELEKPLPRSSSSQGSSSTTASGQDTIINNGIQIAQQGLNNNSFYHQLFLDHRVNNDLLRYVKTSFSRPDPTNFPFSEIVSWCEVMDIFVQMDDIPELTFGCQRLTEMYGEQTPETYREYLEIAEDEENYSVMGFLGEKIKELKVFAVKPEYLQNFMADAPLPTETEILYNLPEFNITDKEAYQMAIDLPPAEIAEILTEGFDQYGLSVNDQAQAKDEILKKWKRMSKADKRALLAPIAKSFIKKMDSSNENLLLFRLMGPSNPMIDSNIYGNGNGGDGNEENIDLDNLCDKYGCRMLYCNCLEITDNEDDVDYEDIDWFLLPGEKYSSCDICFKLLPNRGYAFRRPIPFGGWKGRYCSTKCALKDLGDIEHNHPNSQGRDKIQRGLIKVYYSELENIGIQDRQNDTDEPEQTCPL